MVSNNAINTPKPIPVGAGGTGSASFTAYGPIIAGATSTAALSSVTPSATSGTPLISQGSSASPIYGTVVTAGGGTGAVSFTAYSLIAGGVTGTAALQSITTGSSGQILQSNGASAIPSWVPSPSVGSWVLIQTQNASSSSSITFTTGLTTYNTLALIYTNVLAQTDITNLLLKYSTNGGSSYLSSNYVSGSLGWNYNSATGTNGTSTSNIILFGGVRNNTNASVNAIAYISGIQGGGVTLTWNNGTSYSDDGVNSPFRYLVGGVNTTLTQVNAISIILSSGNIVAGTFSLYGIMD